MIRGQAVLIAVAVGWDGRRSVLGVELANRESRSSWRDFLLGLKERGLHGVEFVVADDHAGLKAALREVLAEAAYQRCYVHFLRNALDYVPRKVDDDCLQELRWLYDRRGLGEARRDLAAWLARWQGKDPKLTGWVEENVEETLTFYRLPRQHHKHLKSTNMLERLNEEIKRRTHVVRLRAALSTPQRRKLPAASTGIGGRDARELAGAAPLPEHGGPARAQKRAAQARRLNAPWTTLRVAHRANPISGHNQIAELYAHNSCCPTSCSSRPSPALNAVWGQRPGNCLQYRVPEPIAGGCLPARSPPVQAQLPTVVRRPRGEPWCAFGSGRTARPARIGASVCRTGSPEPRRRPSRGGPPSAPRSRCPRRSS